MGEAQAPPAQEEIKAQPEKPQQKFELPVGGTLLGESPAYDQEDEDEEVWVEIDEETGEEYVWVEEDEDEEE